MNAQVGVHLLSRTKVTGLRLSQTVPDGLRVDSAGESGKVTLSAPPDSSQLPDGAAAAAAAAASQSAGSSSPWWWALAGLGGVGVSGAGVVLFVRRRRPSALAP